MYLPPRFAGDDKVGLELIQAHPFATLISSGPQGLTIDHLPLVLSEGKIWGHLAYANPHWQSFNLSSMTAVFHGPHAFVDHQWYTHPGQQVPTWNYTAAHVEGPLTLYHDYASLMNILDKLQDRMNPGPSWASAAPEDLKLSLEKSIVGFSLEIRSLQTKLKLSQNRSEQDPFRVMNALKASPRAMDQEVGQLMENYFRREETKR